MKKICMVEYQGRVDEKGEPVGHGPKVFSEYYGLLKDQFDICAFGTREILNVLTSKYNVRSKVLEGKIVMKGKNSFFEKIANKIHMFKNIGAAMKNADADTIWFFNSEYYLMLYLALHKKSTKRVVVTMFLDGYHGGFVNKVKQFIFEQAQKKIDMIIASGANFTFKNCDSIYIPDYYYEPAVYDYYKAQKKSDRCVCLGTMGAGKELDDLVEAFSKNGYPLHIVGRFYDKDWYEALKSKASDNITIEDRYLSEEDYMTLLSTSRYTVLPYNPAKYNTQTSGVMQEAVFTDTIVVAFEQVLNGNDTSGVSFLSWQQCGQLDLHKDYRDVLCRYERQRNTIYNIKEIRNKYEEVL